VGIVAALAMAPIAAHAQRASENAVTAADDAFGTTVGNETIGIYNDFDVRGFSPLQSGNARIEGLYFDRVGDGNDRLLESSRIRVGIAAQGYAFPAPTGIVDYALRTPGDVAGLSMFAEGNSFGYNTFQFDGTQPLGRTLSIGGGAGYNHNVFANGGENYEGNIAVLFRWQPLPNLEILPFWSRKDTFAQKDGEVYEPEGDFLPSPVPVRHFFGPQWATGSDFSVNYGSLLRYSFSSWLLRLGIFRSEQANPISNFPYLDLVTHNQGELDVDASPPSHLGSTSGEFRLEKSFARGPWVHRLIFSLRGRNWNGLYGNAITVNVAPQTIDQAVNSPKPSLQFGSLTHDHVDARWIGFEYQLARKNWLQVSLGAQKARYHKDTLTPGEVPALLDATPWLLSGSATGYVTDKLAMFASYTQGLEDNGITPSNATNSNEALPATTSRQIDGGVQWTLLPRTNFVATVFDLKKAYFNLDPSNVYRELGGLENKGLELSLTGNLTDRLNLVVGGVLSQPVVSGDAVRLGITGDRPVGIYSRKFVFGANWRPPGTSGLSFDLGANYSGSVPGSLDDAVSAPPHTTVNWDTRYEFKMAGQSASLKFAVNNMFNVRGLQVFDSDTYGFFFGSGRRIDLRLIVDL
jgi:iron complex outermembrane receptor protein